MQCWSTRRTLSRDAIESLTACDFLHGHSYHVLKPEELPSQNRAMMFHEVVIRAGTSETESNSNVRAVSCARASWATHVSAVT